MTHWDVAIVGAGAAGMPAAIKAAERGARVLLIDAAEVVGGALHLSSGSYSAGGNARQQALGIADSAAAHYDDCIRLNHGTGDKVKLRLWTDNSPVTLEWLFENGLEMDANQPEMNHSHEPYKVPRIYTPPKGGLSHLAVLKGLLDPLVEEGKVTLMLGSRVTGLIADGAGGVKGLVADRGGETVEILAKNVVLACGGYAHSPGYWRELHSLPGNTYSYPFARGDGIGLARAVGGQVGNVGDHLPTFGGTVDIDNPGDIWIHTRTSPVYRMPWEIFVNLDGRRFLQEDRLGRDWRERVIINQPGQAFWVIYDEAIRREAPPFLLMPPEKIERAFRDHPDYRKADTIEALAATCGLPAQALADTIARYNAGQAVGSDEMGREFLPRQIGEGPFYAVKHHSFSVVTFGGVLADDNFNVITSDGAPIANLYAVGELLGHGVLGNCFLGGSMVSACMTFGRLLGERILAWD